MDILIPDCWESKKEINGTESKGSQKSLIMRCTSLHSTSVSALYSSRGSWDVICPEKVSSMIEKILFHTWRKIVEE
jgi:hypothetical protein